MLFCHIHINVHYTIKCIIYNIYKYTCIYIYNILYNIYSIIYNIYYIYKALPKSDVNNIYIYIHTLISYLNLYMND